MTALQSITHARRNGVSPSGYHVLLSLLEDSPQVPSRIALLTGISTAAVTGMVDALEDKGWLERVELPNDRRKRAVRPTEKAFTVFACWSAEPLPAPCASVATTEHSASPVMGVKIAPDGAGNSPDAYPFPWVKQPSGWIKAADGYIVCAMSGCGIGPDANGRILEATGDMLEVVRRVANGGMSYPTHHRTMAQTILDKISGNPLQTEPKP